MGLKKFVEISRSVYCPNPKYQGKQDLEACMECECHRGITLSGTSVKCAFLDQE